MTTIKLRRDTAANWTANGTVVLASGEPGYETDTGKIKYGNGTTTWANLSYSTLSYNSLTDKPTLFSGSYNDLTNKPASGGETFLEFYFDNWYASYGQNYTDRNIFPTLMFNGITGASLTTNGNTTLTLPAGDYVFIMSGGPGTYNQGQFRFYDNTNGRALRNSDTNGIEWADTGSNGGNGTSSRVETLTGSTVITFPSYSTNNPTILNRRIFKIVKIS